MGHNVVIHGKSVQDGTEVIPIEVDPSGSLVFVTHEHGQIHASNFFSSGYLNSAVASAGTIAVLFETGANEIHSFLKLIAGGDALFEVFEDVTTSSDGTLMTATGHNRTEPGTTNVTWYHTPTVTDFGTTLWEEYIPGGSSGQTPGAVQFVGTEQVIFKPNTKYVLRLTNEANGVEPLQITMAYYQGPA